MGKTIRYPIVVENLSWSYGEKEILRDVSMRFEREKLYSIIGPNGSGKTTLLRNISRALKTHNDRVFINETDLCNLKSRDIARLISCVPQNTNIDFEFSVMDIVLMGRNPYLGRFGTEGKKDLEIAQRAMEATNTWHLRDKDINRISGGEKQRAIVARALAQETGIMLLDEPVSQLDIHHQVELMDTIKELVAGRQMTAVCVLHDLNLAAQYSDYIILLDQGKILCQGTVDTVLTRENLESIYKTKISVVKNPVNGKPLIIPLAGGSIKTAAS